MKPYLICGYLDKELYCLALDLTNFHFPKQCGVQCCAVLCSWLWYPCLPCTSCPAGPALPPPPAPGSSHHMPQFYTHCSVHCTHCTVVLYTLYACTSATSYLLPLPSSLSFTNCVLTGRGALQMVV